MRHQVAILMKILMNKTEAVEQVSAQKILWKQKFKRSNDESKNICFSLNISELVHHFDLF